MCVSIVTCKMVGAIGNWKSLRIATFGAVPVFTITVRKAAKLPEVAPSSSLAQFNSVLFV